MRILTHGYCVDNTGVVFVKLIKVLGNSYKKQAEVGDRVAVVIAAINVKAKNMQDERKRRKLRSGSVHRAIVVQTKIRFKR
jgi:ribosomal protein L14